MTANKKKIALRRVSMNLPLDLTQKVEDYGKRMGLNTTSAYIVLLNQALDQKNTFDNLPKLMDIYKSLPTSFFENIDASNETKETDK